MILATAVDCCLVLVTVSGHRAGTGAHDTQNENIACHGQKAVFETTCHYKKSMGIKCHVGFTTF